MKRVELWKNKIEYLYNLLAFNRNQVSNEHWMQVATCVVFRADNALHEESHL